MKPPPEYSPDWERSLVEGTPERRRLLASLEGRGRRRALFIDPGLAVRAGGQPEVSADDVAEIKKAVLQARRLRSMERHAESSGTHRASGLAIAMALLLLLLVPAGVKRTSEPVHQDERTALPLTHSSVEALDLPGARVYELAEEEFSLVLVVDESFEL